MKKINHKTYYRSLIVATGLVASLAVVVPAFAQTPPSGSATVSANSSVSGHGGWGMGGMAGGHMMGRMPGVFGTVTAISGTTLAVTSKTFQRPAGAPGSTGSGSTATPTAPTPTIYTVNASNATVTKSGATSTISSIAVGDTVMVQGTVSGTSVTATKINDGLVPRPSGPNTPGSQSNQGHGAPASIIQGNGEPVVAGSVSAISGSTLTVTNKSNVTYSVDASNATIEKNNATSSVASIATGDSVIIQGTVNGTSITASSVIDSGATTSASGTSGKAPAPRGFFGAIGSFFSHIFGF